MKINVLAGALFALMLGSPAHAEYTLSIQQVGPDVVSTGSGTLNTTGLTQAGTLFFTANGAMTPGRIVAGSCSPKSNRQYNGITGPASLPVTGSAGGSSASGDCVTLTAATLTVPETPAAYISGAPLSSLNTYSARTLASLGLNPGTYVWTWGAGPTADRFILQIGPSAAPVPTLSEWAMILLGLMMAGGAAVVIQRRRSQSNGPHP